MDHEATVAAVGVQPGEDADAPVALLDADGRVLPIYITHDQAQSMQLALDGRSFDRPLTHDLLSEMVAELGGAIDRVRIDSLADGTFLAKIDTEQYRNGERTERVFDARPSDAVALALRVECSILIADSVLDRAGQRRDELGLGETDEDR